jgi:hypothetical protein
MHGGTAAGLSHVPRNGGRWGVGVCGRTVVGVAPPAPRGRGGVLGVPETAVAPPAGRPKRTEKRKKATPAVLSKQTDVVRSIHFSPKYGSEMGRTGERFTHMSARLLLSSPGPPGSHLASTVFSTACTDQSAPPLRPRPPCRQRDIDASPGRLRRPSIPDASMTTLGGVRPASHGQRLYKAMSGTPRPHTEPP